MEKLEPATMSDYQRLKVELIRCIDDILGTNVKPKTGAKWRMIQHE